MIRANLTSLTTIPVPTQLLKHLVCLQWRQDYAPNASTVAWRYENASGFIVSIQDHWFLLTAGHVLDDFDEAQKRGDKFSEWALDDTSGTQMTLNLPNPFPEYNDVIKHRVTTDGQDFALIYLPKRCRKLMEAIGKSALGEQAWHNPNPSTYDAYCMVGVPEEFITRPNGSLIDNKTDVLLTVEPLNKLPHDITKRKNSFYGKIAVQLGTENVPLTDIKGMSGCPIFGITFSSSGALYRYWVFALQSGWYKSQQIIRACPVRAFLEQVTDMIKNGQFDIHNETAD